MRDLEEKEKALNKLKVKSDGLVNNNHPATDKIYVRCFGEFCCPVQPATHWVLH